MSVEFHCVAVFEASCCIDFNDLLVFLYMHLFITNIISKHAGTPTLVYMMFFIHSDEIVFLLKTILFLWR